MKNYIKIWRNILQIDKLKGYLNICKKANYIIIGGENLKYYDKKLFLILYDKSAKKNTLKILDNFKDKNINIIEIENLDNLLNIESCKIVGIKNKSLSEIIINIIKNNEN